MSVLWLYTSQSAVPQRDWQFQEIPDKLAVTTSAKEISSDRDATVLMETPPLINRLQTGFCVPESLLRQRTSCHWLLYGPTDVAIRPLDIITATAEVQTSALRSLKRKS